MKLKFRTDEDHSRDIKLDDTLTLRMKYPTLSQFISNNFDFSGNDNDSVEQSFEMIATCMDLVYNDEESWAASDCTQKRIDNLD